MKTALVGNAKEVARQWVTDEGTRIPGFQGAFFHGSINDLADDASFPSTSDVDVLVVLEAPETIEKLGKFRYRDVLLEVSYLSADQLASAEQVLGNYHLAGSFRAPGIIADPTGRLGALQIAVSRDFAKREWVWKRCEHARNNCRNFAASLDKSAPFPAQVTSWLFAAGVTTHILLVAGLRNPTVRRRYMATRELLADYSLLDSYQPLLEMLGCAAMSRERAEQHLASLAEAFDATKTILKTPYRFAADLSESGRPIAIDGSRELIERGFHREAVFWMVATYSRCLTVLAQDASVEVQEQLGTGYRALVGDLGIASFADLSERCDQVRRSLPRVREVAERILSVNSEIKE